MDLIFKQHVSQLDQSVNFEHRFADHPGMLEARYVRRVDDYFIVYLSSQTGCEQACRMCWLTATGQNKTRDVTVQEYLDQAKEVLKYYDERNPAKMVHFNFMARGEPFANKIFLEHADEVLAGLATLAKERGLEYKFLISTIFPEEVGYIDLTEIFKEPALYPELYYSIYSMDKKFRRRWLPKAASPERALDELKAWQEHTGKIPKIHYAFINNENDSLGAVKAICDEIVELELDVNWNVVRYNPPEGHYSKETVEGQIHYLAGYIRSRLPKARVKVIPRVGTDVQASCGTFLK
jgi:adenine C2-methylase RlmN of 23S rRNA A2503 and tRNA A37